MCPKCKGAKQFFQKSHFLSHTECPNCGEISCEYVEKGGEKIKTNSEGPIALKYAGKVHQYYDKKGNGIDKGGFVKGKDV